MHTAGFRVTVGFRIYYTLGRILTNISKMLSEPNKTTKTIVYFFTTIIHVVV